MNKIPPTPPEDEKKPTDRAPSTPTSQPTHTPPPEHPGPKEADLPPGFTKEVEAIPLKIERAHTSPARDPGPETAKSPAPSKPPSEHARPHRPAAKAPRPAVYELDMNLPEEILGGKAHTDASKDTSPRPRAKPSRRAPHKPSDPAPETSLEPGQSGAPPEPAQPQTPLGDLDTWRNLPGADKVLRIPTPSPGQKNPPSAAARRETPDEEEPPAAPKTPMSRYDQLRKRPSISMAPEDVRTANEFSEILFHISRALVLLQRFREKYPYLIAPNVFAVWEDNMKESSTTMLREFQSLKNPRARHYEKKFVCKLCKSVFFVSLPDGICDECRGKMGPKASN